MHLIFDVATACIAACSLLHTMCPPWEVLNDFPVAQKYYKVFIYTIGFVALNGRSTVYKSISTTEGAYTSCATDGPNSPSNPINKEQK